MSATDEDYKGKVAAVIGTASGIGLAQAVLAAGRRRRKGEMAF
jgi:NAD(P)-dependent dehydrogenase (short-subunit alcohol dehydrogenase family)